MVFRDILGTRQRNRVEDFTDRWRDEGYTPMTTPPGMGPPESRDEKPGPAVVGYTPDIKA